MAAPSLQTNLSIVQLPTTYPNVGGLYGKNTIVTDPNFGAKIIRLTDASTDLTGKFDSLQTADASQNMLWNSNDTLILVKNTGGYSYLIQFNPTTLQGTQLSFNTANSTAFAFTNPGIIYEVAGTLLNQILFTFTSGVWVYTSTTTIADFGNGGAGGAGFLPAGFVPAWNSAFTHDNLDTTFTVAFSTGQQNTGIYVCSYTVGLGYRILNTNTGAVTGQWGASGTATITNWQGVTGGTANAFPFLIHETFQARTPNYCHITAVKSIGGNPLIWDIPTLNIQGVRQGGHCSQGYLAEYTGGVGDGQFQAFPFSNTTLPTFIMDVSPNRGQLPADQVPKQSYIGDQHAGLPNGGTTDDCLLWVGNGPPPTFPFTSCWQGEIRGIDITGLVGGTMGVVYRACHTFNSCQSPQFIVQNTMAVPSQTGNFVAFTSDWGGSGTVGPLGSITGGPTGVIGGNARGDVFVVAIPTTNSAPTITSANNATFTQGVFGSFSVTTTGFPTPAITEAGTLPSGVSFVDNGNGTATLSGTPGPSGSFSLTITATNSVGSVNQPFTLTVTSAATAPTITSANNTTFTQGVLGSFSVTTTGIPTPSITEVGSLPSGVTFVDNGNGTATLRGTPTASGSFPLTITATNTAGTANQPFTLTVTSVSPPVAPTITSSNNTSFSLGVFASFQVVTTGTPTPSITEAGSLPGGITFVDNGNGTATLSGTATASGSFPFTITAANTVLPNATQPFTLTVNVTPIAPRITSANNAQFTRNHFGSFIVNSTGTPTPTISQGSGNLPNGVTLVDNGNGTGTLSGTATTVGVYTFTILASNGVLPAAHQPFTLTIVSTNIPVSITGTFKYPNGSPVANAIYQWKLSADAVNISTAAMAPVLFSGTLDANGNMAASFTFNDQLQTQLGATTKYQLTIKNQAGQQVWNESYYLTGTAVNLTLIPPG